MSARLGDCEVVEAKELWDNVCTWAWENLPEEYRASVSRVWKDPAFEVRDLAWISMALGLTIRVTIAREVRNILPGPEDLLFGSSTPDVHLFFSWCNGKFGHYDLLVPNNRRGHHGMALALDVALRDFGMFIYIYIRMYVMYVYRYKYIIYIYIN